MYDVAGNGGKPVILNGTRVYNLETKAKIVLILFPRYAILSCKSL